MLAFTRLYKCIQDRIQARRSAQWITSSLRMGSEDCSVSQNTLGRGSMKSPICVLLILRVNGCKMRVLNSLPSVGPTGTVTD